MLVLCLYCNESRPTMNQIGDQGRPKEVSAMLGAWIADPVKRMGQQSQARALIITRFYFFNTNQFQYQPSGLSIHGETLNLIVKGFSYLWGTLNTDQQMPSILTGWLGYINTKE